MAPSLIAATAVPDLFVAIHLKRVYASAVVDSSRIWNESVKDSAASHMFLPPLHKRFALDGPFDEATAWLTTVN
jgi:hypothetical protein